MDNPKVLVTGGTRGIGKATVVEFAKAGFDVAYTGRTLNAGEAVDINADGSTSILPGSLAETQAALAAYPIEGLPLQMDLLDPDSVDMTINNILEKWGHIDVLVNNAFYESGEYTDKWIKDIPMAEFQRKMQANFFAPLALIKGFLPSMLARKSGRVINLSTRHNYTRQHAPPGAGSASVCYNCSKAAEGKLADGLAAEHGADGIAAFDVDPGPVWTERGAAQNERLGFPKEIFCPLAVPASVVVWLATDTEAPQYNGCHFMAQEFALQRQLHPDWGGALPMNDAWRPGRELDWVVPDADPAH